jgi:hypothetical protein
MTTVYPIELMCDYKDAARKYPEDYTGIFWLNKNPTKNLPVPNTFSESLHYDQYGTQWTAGIDVNYFDPTKPSVIHIHGWQNKTISATLRNFSSISSNYTQTIAHAGWFPDWNVGIYRWEPFADDDDVSLANGVFVPNPRNAEAKIHNKAKMRHRNNTNDGFSTLPNTSRLYDKSISDMFVDAFQMIPFANDKEVRLTGHSLGGQLALSAAAKLKKSSDHIRRIELLDVFFCNGQNDGYTSKPQSSSAMARSNLAQINQSTLKPDVAVSWYQCTNLTDCDIVGCSNTELKKRVSWQGLRLWYLDGYTQVSSLHSECISWYYNTKRITKNLVTYVYKPPSWYGWGSYTKIMNAADNALSANTDTQLIKDNMYLPKYWVQLYNDTMWINKKDGKMDVTGADGTKTDDVNDDAFWVVTESHCPDELALYEYFTCAFSVGETLEIADNLCQNDNGDAR